MADKRFLDFLAAEKARRDFESQRAFARWLGLAPATVWQVMDGGREPGLDFLIATSKATGVGIRELIEMAYPGTLPPTELSADATILAQQIDQLPDGIREAVRAFIRGAIQRNDAENGK